MAPLAACSSSHHASSGASTSSTTSTTAELLPGVDSSSSTTARPGSPTSTTATRPLSAAVLTVTDLPGGWSVAPQPLSDRSLCPGQDPTAAVPATANADASFEQGESGPRLTSFLAAFKDVTTARLFLAHADDAIAACASYQVSGATFHLRPIASPGVGDQSLGAELSSDSTLGGGLHGQVLYARVGSRVVTIVFGGGGNVDESVALRALRTVAARL